MKTFIASVSILTLTVALFAGNVFAESSTSLRQDQKLLMCVNMSKRVKLSSNGSNYSEQVRTVRKSIDNCNTWAPDRKNEWEAEFDKIIANSEGSFFNSRDENNAAEVAAAVNKENCDNRISDVMGAQIKSGLAIEETVRVENVKRMNGYKGAIADVGGMAEAVGYFVLPNSNERLGCNTTYMEYPNGLKGMVASAHCFYDENGLRAPLSDFPTIKFGFSREGPADDEVTITDIFCGTKDPRGLTLTGKERTDYEMGVYNEKVYNDECFIVTNRLPKMKPLKRKFLSMHEMNALRTAGKGILLLGFHPGRYEAKGANGQLQREFVYSKKRNKKGKYVNDKKFYADRTRTVQGCKIQSNPFDETGDAKRIYHNCDTMGNTSGAPIAYWDTQDKQLYVIGVHRSYDARAESNLAVSVRSKDLIEDERRVVQR